MKQREIIKEVPYYDPDAKITVPDMNPSIDGMQRDNNLLGRENIRGTLFYFWLNNSNQSAYVTIDFMNENKLPRQKIITIVRFKIGSDLPISNSLQVNEVYTDESYRQLNLAGKLYLNIVNNGLIVISDLNHKKGGKGLWKALARDSISSNYYVLVWDDGDSDWIKDNQGNPIKYTANNLNDEKIWHDISAVSTTLLVLSKGKLPSLTFGSR